MQYSCDSFERFLFNSRSFSVFVIHLLALIHPSFSSLFVLCLSSFIVDSGVEYRRKAKLECCTDSTGSFRPWPSSTWVPIHWTMPPIIRKTTYWRRGTRSKRIWDAALQALDFFFPFLLVEWVKFDGCPFLAGVRALRDVGVDVVSIDPCSDPECAAESAALTRWQFQDLKSAAKRKPDIEVILHGSDEIGLATLPFWFHCRYSRS